MDENTPDWAKEALPETLHSVPFLKDTESPEQFVERLSHAASHMGNSIRIPGQDANEDAWAEFDQKLQAKVPSLMRVDTDDPDALASLYNRLGKPEDAKGYEAGDDYNWLAEVAHHTGLTKSQFKTMVEKLGEVNESRQLERGAEHQEALDALYKEWGLSKPKKLEQITGLAKLTNAPEALLQQIEEGKADPATLHWLSEMADKFGQSQNFVKDKNDEAAISPAEARAQIDELLKSGKLFDSTNPLVQQDAQKRMVELQKAANPSATNDISTLQATGPQLQEMFDQS